MMCVASSLRTGRAGARRVGRLYPLGVCAAIWMAVATLAGPGVAFANGPSIAETGSPQFPERAYALHIPSKLALDVSEVSVRENGQAVGGVTVSSADRGSGRSFATVLVIDASDSMRGRPIAEAMRAAQAFAERRAQGQRLAVLAFNGRTSVVLSPTRDAEQIEDALSSAPELRPATRVYDAVDAALGMLRDAKVPAGSIVVLSDGADTGSRVTLAELADRAEAAGVRVFAVGLRSRHFRPETLEGLAIGGSFADAARPEDLGPIFDRFGAQLASEYLIGYRSPANTREPVTVEVRVEGVPGIARDRYRVPRSAFAGPEAARGFWGSTEAMLGAIGLAAVLLGWALFVLVRPRRRTIRERLAHLIQIEARVEGGDSDEPRAGPLARLGNSLERSPRWKRLEEELAIARIEIPAIRLAALTLLGTLLAMVLLAQATGYAVLAPLGLSVAWGARMYLNRRLRKQRRAFADQLADNLQIVSSALRAGQSMVGAMAVVVEEAAEPTRTEFGRIVSDERIGVPLEDAIRDVGRRMDNRDMEQVALVATIQRETGGNTAEILDQVSETIRERAKLRRLMETLTAQGRLSQIIVSALPLALLLAITIVNGAYLEPLLETSGGHILLAVAAALSVTGSLIIKRIVEVRV